MGSWKGLADGANFTPSTAINQQRAALKKAWILDQLQYGYVFKKADVRGKVFIDYVPAEYAWSPVVAPGYVDVMIRVAEKRGIEAEKIKIKTYQEAQELSAPFGVACVFLDGEFLTQEIMTESKFSKILESSTL